MIKHDLCIVQYCIGLCKTVLLLVVPPLNRNQFALPGMTNGLMALV